MQPPALPSPLKVLTICQPYAHLICLPESDPRHKRIENRTWATNYRGPLAIHAGKNRKWLGTFDVPAQEVRAMPFGAIVAVCELVACLKVITEDDERHFSASYEESNWCGWAYDHMHAEGPYCLVLNNVRVLKNPIEMPGSLGFWDWYPPRGLEFIDCNAFARKLASDRDTHDHGSQQSFAFGGK